ncbi:HET-domain-containing protein [Lophiostoma macrostomum CBS 122681]|uniref:HET-domain-containing protein n=1 Tax=Lophiostoma macrostomum CBS 122681 TaxID=1314788 RepID=A0A6A6TJK9_9PLEO|nr:HET-domain-containing protein [Lophiostoma macrostomum CBS 122681]
MQAPDAIAGATAPVSSATSTSRASYQVPLHKLCSTCTSFARHHPLLTQLETIVDSSDAAAWPYRGDRSEAVEWTLCTVRQLLAGAGSRDRGCHFCGLVLGIWRDGRREVGGSAEDALTGLEEEEEDEEVVLRLRPLGQNLVLPPGMHPEYIEVYVKDRYEQERKLISPMICRMQIQQMDPTEPWRDPSLLYSKSVPATASSNIKLVAQWLRECESAHEDCARNLRSVPATSSDSDTLPTRLLDLSSGCVRLICKESLANPFLDPSTRYLTLSHMWGPSATSHIRLLTTTLAPFQSSISYESLSTIYREAIRITRELGYRYLWIDSLCIMQDSAEDWQIEANRMAMVYGNSTLNISYIFPPEDALEGGRRREDPRRWIPCRLRSIRPKPIKEGSEEQLELDQDPHSSVFPGLYASWQLERASPPWLDTAKWPLLSRAWVYQERILSPRILYVGHEALVWECYHGLNDELLGPARFDRLPGTSWILQKKDFMDWVARLRYKVTHRRYPMNKIGFKQEDFRHIVGFTNFWNQVVIEYKEKTLTFATDRVIAFAGVASAVQNFTGCTYRAGLWQETLPMSLLWQFSRSGMVVEESVPFVPSWSWFSVRIREKNGIWGKDQAGISNGMRAGDALVYRASVKKVKCAMPRAARFDNPMGTEILLELLTTPATFVKSGNKVRMSVPSLEVECEKGTSDGEIDYCHDDRVDAERVFGNDSNGVVAGLVTELLLERKDGNAFDSHVLEGLSLVRCPDRDAWLRVGRWRYHVAEYHSKVPLPTCRKPYFERFGKWERTSIWLA